MPRERDGPPDTVRLAEMAVCASILGERLTICLNGYSAHSVARLLHQFTVWWGEGSIVTLQQAADIDKLLELQKESEEEQKNLQEDSQEEDQERRVVFIRNPQIYSDLAWAIHTCARRVGSHQRPAQFALPIFTTAHIDPDTDPGATLVLHPHPAELDRLSNYLASGEADGELVYAFCPPAEMVNHLRRAFDHAVAPALQRARDREVVRALWTGALCLPLEESRPAARIAAAYAEVRRVLLGRVARPPDEPSSPLAAAMVSRANVYLKFRNETAKTNNLVQLNTTRARDSVETRVTRVELVDLGNIKSSLLAELVGWVLAQNRFDDYLHLGLKATTHPAGWPDRDVALLANRLLGWSYKQVRTCFDKLTKDELIGSAREANNGPRLFTLPEALTQRAEGFDLLPPVAVVEAALGLGSDLTSDSACPACPPSA